MPTSQLFRTVIALALFKAPVQIHISKILFGNHILYSHIAVEYAQLAIVDRHIEVDAVP